MSKDSELYKIIEGIAAELVVNASFIEKDWYAMGIMGVLSHIQNPKFQLVFSGGTSLSKGFGLIQRFSEDLDFKVQTIENGKPSRTERRAFREQILQTLTQDQQDWSIDPESVQKGNGSQFFKVPIKYNSQFDRVEGLRPYIQLEVTFENPIILPEKRPLQSFVGQAQKQKPEVSSFPCISPVETAADKLSALVWRVTTRDRNSEKDDPTLIRHLHDLAALEKNAFSSPEFAKLAKDCLKKDSQRAKQKQDLSFQLDSFLHILESDNLYKQEYETFVRGMSYADESEQISFEDGKAALKKLLTLLNK